MHPFSANYDDATLWTTVVLVLVGTILVWRHRRSNNHGDQIPWAPGGVPILGHALAYRRDPPGFLLRGKTECGPIFRVNLAGRIMVLVCGSEEQRKLAAAPESVLSARIAVAEIGFEQTLGYKNVHDGTQIHKGIVKGMTNDNRQILAWRKAFREAFRLELSVGEVDFLVFVRRVLLRASVERFVGTAFLRDWTAFDFLNEFMQFQDTLEDVTAKAAVLPKWVSLPFLLWPFQRRRERLQTIIQKRLETILQQQDTKEDDDVGFWLHEVLDQKTAVPVIAEYIVGLMFAAHKNPAIGAAQSYLMLNELASKDVKANCREEAKALLSTTTWSSQPTLRLACLETLRLTAHSIGAVRTPKQDVTLSVGAASYTIPKGSTVGFAHITSSLETSVWGETAASYNLNRNTVEELYGDEYAFTTFSHGTHKCPGRQLSMVHLQTIVALLLTEYDVQLPQALPKLDFERATLAQREGPVMVSITPKQQR